MLLGKKKDSAIPKWKKVSLFRKTQKHFDEYFEGETFGFQGQVVDVKPLSTLIFTVNVLAVQYDWNVYPLVGNVGEKNVWTPQTTHHLDFHDKCSCRATRLKCVACYGDCRGKECMNISEIVSNDDDGYEELKYFN